jgi:hypothetical protein
LLTSTYPSKLRNKRRNPRRLVSQALVVLCMIDHSSILRLLGCNGMIGSASCMEPNFLPCYRVIIWHNPRAMLSSSKVATHQTWRALGTPNASPWSFLLNSVFARDDTVPTTIRALWPSYILNTRNIDWKIWKSESAAFLA